MAPAPATTSKRNKRVSFADPVATVLGEFPAVECEIHSTVKNQIDPILCSEHRLLCSDPMLDGFLLFGHEGTKAIKLDVNAGNELGSGTGLHVATGVATLTIPVSNHNSVILQQADRLNPVSEVPSYDNTIDLEVEFNSRGNECTVDSTHHVLSPGQLRNTLRVGLCATEL